MGRKTLRSFNVLFCYWLSMAGCAQHSAQHVWSWSDWPLATSPSHLWCIQRKQDSLTTVQTPPLHKGSQRLPAHCCRLSPTSIVDAPSSKWSLKSRMNILISSGDQLTNRCICAHGLLAAVMPVSSGLPIPWLWLWISNIQVINT